MLRLYDGKSGNVEEIPLARAGVIRVGCDGRPRSLVVADLIRRLAGHHGLRAIGVWDTPLPRTTPAAETPAAETPNAETPPAGTPTARRPDAGTPNGNADLPSAADLNVRPPELASGGHDVYVGGTVGRCSLGAVDGLDPLAVRFALLEHHYRADVTLTREDLARADSALVSWRRLMARWAESPGRPLSQEYVDEAVAALDSDLDTPAIFPVISRLAEDTSVAPGSRFETMIKLDMILGLDLVGLVGRL